MNGLKPYERPASTNYTEAQRARREEAQRDERILKARASLDRLQGRALHAQRLLREVLDALPPTHQELRRHALDLCARSLLLATALREAADQAAREAAARRP